MFLLQWYIKCWVMDCGKFKPFINGNWLFRPGVLSQEKVCEGLWLSVEDESVVLNACPMAMGHVIYSLRVVCGHLGLSMAHLTQQSLTFSDIPVLCYSQTSLQHCKHQLSLFSESFMVISDKFFTEVQSNFSSAPNDKGQVKMLSALLCLGGWFARASSEDLGMPFQLDLDASPHHLCVAEISTWPQGLLHTCGQAQLGRKPGGWECGG